METHVGAGQSAETAADKYATTLKLVNDWRQSQAAAKGGDYFRCPRCGAPRFVSAASRPDGVLFCSRAHHAARAERRKPEAERRAERRKPGAARLHLRGPGPEIARVAQSRGRRRRVA